MAEQQFDAGALRTLCETTRINRTCQHASEFAHAERRVSAVARNTTRLQLAINGDDASNSEAFQPRRRGKAGRAGTDNERICAEWPPRLPTFMPRLRPPEATRNAPPSAQRDAHGNRSLGIGPYRTACDS